MAFVRWNDINTMKFINLYKQEECLWNISLHDYKNKEARNLALERIAAAMGLEGFGVSDVKYKIKNIRSSYCQELKKIQFSEASCSSPEDVYRPTVVWFNTLHAFLKSFVFQRERPPPYPPVSSLFTLTVSRYSDGLQAGRPRNWGLIPGRVKMFPCSPKHRDRLFSIGTRG
jgi:hypothetical protein